MIAGGRTRRIFSQSTQQRPYLQEAYALAAIAIVPVVRSLQLEVGVTRRELCAALNDSLQVRLEPRSSSVCRRGFTVPFSFHPEGHSTVSRQGQTPQCIRAFATCAGMENSGNLRLSFTRRDNAHPVAFPT